MGSVSTAPLPLVIVSLPLLGLAGGFLAYPAYAQSNNPPAEPTGLGASVASGVGVNLTWNVSADATITGYEVLRRNRAVYGQGVFHTFEPDTGQRGHGLHRRHGGGGPRLPVPGESHQPPRQ